MDPAAMNVKSKVADVFLTAGNAFQKLGDLLQQLQKTTENKWSDEELDKLQDALTQFDHELDQISASRNTNDTKTNVEKENNEIVKKAAENCPNLDDKSKIVQKIEEPKDPNSVDKSKFKPIDGDQMGISNDTVQYFSAPHFGEYFSLKTKKWYAWINNKYVEIDLKNRKNVKHAAISETSASKPSKSAAIGMHTVPLAQKPIVQPTTKILATTETSKSSKIGSLSKNQSAPWNLKSKVADVFVTAGNAFQKLGDLTQQLHTTTDMDENKWSDEELDKLQDALTRFSHEIDQISASRKTNDKKK